MPSIKFLACGMAALTIIAAPALAQEDLDPDELTMQQNALTYWRGDVAPMVENDGWMKIPTRPKEDYIANTMMPSLSAEAKMKMMQSMIALNPFSLREMISLLVAKKKVLEGITFDEVIESLELKANELNMRAVSHSTPYVILREIYEPDSPRVEFFSFCDLITMRKIVDYSLEFIAFLPCSIAVLEDANEDIWVVTLDWDVRWMDTSPNPNKISPDLRARAISVRERIEEILEAAANGDL